MSKGTPDRRSLWRAFGKSEDKKVVPWFSMSEWKSVRDLLYSESSADHLLGFNRLRGWKARCPSLPAPVECSLSIFHVLLGDPDYLTPRATSLTREQELRLMYSTAVMRFLNLMLGAQHEDLSGTMYSRASMRNIPEWLVNLRHDAAHGKSVPELSLLRGAALFIRKWLFEYYWDDDNVEISDWVVSSEVEPFPSVGLKELQSIVEAWDALSLFKLSGFNNLSQIPYSADLRCSIVVIKNLQQSLEDEDHVKISQKASQKKPAKLTSALALLESKLKNFMNRNLHAIDIQDSLCDMLISGDVLLPSENLLKIIVSGEEIALDNIQALPPVLEEHWSGMMSTLWDVESIPILLRKLISVSTDGLKGNLQSNLASLWARKLILSCTKVREARKVHCAIAAENKFDEVFSAYQSSMVHSNRKEVLASVSVAAVENQREELIAAYTWQLLPLPESLLSMDLVRHALSSPPPEHSRLFLPLLFDLVHPPIPETIQTRLMELITICNQGELDRVAENEDRLYSVADILRPMDSATERESDRSLLPHVKNSWLQSKEHLDWGSCPLGLLPWQQKQAHHDIKEYELRQKQRTWSRLSLEGEWKTSDSDNSASVTSTAAQTVSVPKDKLRVVQSGKVMKPQIFTPKGDKKKSFKKLSPHIAQLLHSC